MQKKLLTDPNFFVSLLFALFSKLSIFLLHNSNRIAIMGLTQIPFVKPSESLIKNIISMNHLESSYDLCVEKLSQKA